jgi:hypothetical protein
MSYSYDGDYLGLVQIDDRKREAVITKRWVPYKYCGQRSGA